MEFYITRFILRSLIGKEVADKALHTLSMFVVGFVLLPILVGTLSYMIVMNVRTENTIQEAETFVTKVYTTEVDTQLNW